MMLYSRSVEIATSPDKILNIKGEDILLVRNIAQEFGRLFGVEPKLVGKEAPTALLNNSQHAYELFGHPKVPISKLLNGLPNG